MVTRASVLLVSVPPTRSGSADTLACLDRYGRSRRTPAAQPIVTLPSAGLKAIEMAR